jgi:anti-sigma B factor antagonist
MKLSFRETKGISVVAITGRVTLGEGATTLRDTLREMMAAGQKRILLDLGGLSSLDSAGIGVLVSSFATLTGQGGQLKLLNLTNRVKDLLLVTKLYTVFEVYDDEAAAVNSFVEHSMESRG